MASVREAMDTLDMTKNAGGIDRTFQGFLSKYRCKGTALDEKKSSESFIDSGATHLSRRRAGTASSGTRASDIRVLTATCSSPLARS